MVGFHLHTLSGLHGRAAWDYMTVRLDRLLSRLVRMVFGRRGGQSAETLRRLGFRQALTSYRAVPYAGRVVLFTGARLPWGIASTRDLGWGSLVDDLEVVELPCYFGTALLEPAVGVLADELERAMETGRQSS
jgi:thioesterase domain-containing protein